MQTMEDLVKSCVAKIVDIPAGSIKDEDSLENDLGADSLDKSEIIWELEKVFRLDIPNEDCEALLTVRDLMNYVKSKAPVLAG